MTTFTITLLHLHNNLQDVYTILKKPLMQPLQNHKMKDHPHVKKICEYIDRYHPVLFWAVHAWNWYFHPHFFYVGMATGMIGTIAEKLGFSDYHCCVIKTPEGMKEYPYAYLIMTLFFTSLSLSFFDGFVSGSYIAHLGTDKIKSNQIPVYEPFFTTPPSPSAAESPEKKD